MARLSRVGDTSLRAICGRDRFATERTEVTRITSSPSCWLFETRVQRAPHPIMSRGRAVCQSPSGRNLIERSVTADAAVICLKTQQSISQRALERFKLRLE